MDERITERMREGERERKLTRSRGTPWYRPNIDLERERERMGGRMGEREGTGKHFPKGRVPWYCLDMFL